PGITERTGVNLPRRSIARQAVSLSSTRQKCTCIEPAVGTGISNVPVTNDDRAVGSSPGVALIAARENGEGRAGLERKYSRQLPSSHDCLQAFVLSCAERQIVNSAQNKSMRDIEVGDRALGTEIPGILRKSRA